MPMCIGSFSLHSKWIGLSKRDPNSSVLRRDVESDRLIGNRDIASFLHCCLTTVDVLKKYRRYLFISESKQLVSSDFATVF